MLQYICADCWKSKQRAKSLRYPRTATGKWFGSNEELMGQMIQGRHPEASIPYKQKNELRANLLNLSGACPFHHTNPKDCPLFSLRKMEPKKRVQGFNVLTEDDLVYMATYHRVCFTTKVESASAKQRTKTQGKKGRRQVAGQLPSRE